MARLIAPPIEAMTAQQRKVYDAIASGPRKGVRGPLAIWLHSPELADKAQTLGAFCRLGTRLPPRLSELAILVIATVWKSEYEWYAHKPLALAAGIASDLVEALLAGKPPAFERADERLTYELLSVLHRTRHVPDEIYQAAREELGEVALVELIGIAGYYTLISMTINVFGVDLPDGVAPAFAPSPSA